MSLAACKPTERPLRLKEARERAAAAREIALTRQAGPGVIRLDGGSCLRLARIASPWSLQDRPDPPQRVRLNDAVIRAAGTAVGLGPYEREGFTESFEGVPHDGLLRIHIQGGPPDGAGYALVPPDDVLARDLRAGTLHRVPPGLARVRR